MKKEHLAIGLIGLGAMSFVPIAAIADPVLNPSVVGTPLVMPRTTSQLLAPAKSVLHMQARDTRDDLRPDMRLRTPTIPLNSTSALSRFSLSFANGDHHIRQIAVLRSGDKAKGVLADNNGDDNFTFTAAWWNIPGAVGGEVTQQQRGGTWQDIDIPAGPPNTTLALAGFSVRSDADAEIQWLEVTLDPETLKARMRMFLVRGSYADQTIDYVLQYVWIPNALIGETRLVTGNGTGASVRLREGTNGTLPSSDRHVLQSFALRYDNNNNAENLARVGVHLAESNVDPRQPSDVIGWQDNDRNERIYWQVKYLTLK
jgi:hypothetical protein